MDKNELLTCAQAGRILGLSRIQVGNLIRAGHLPAIQLTGAPGGIYAIRRADLPAAKKRGR